MALSRIQSLATARPALGRRQPNQFRRGWHVFDDLGRIWTDAQIAKIREVRRRRFRLAGVGNVEHALEHEPYVFLRVSWKLGEPPNAGNVLTPTRRADIDRAQRFPDRFVARPE